MNAVPVEPTCRTRAATPPRPFPAPTDPASHPLRLAVATEADREAIGRIRHEVYARELGQHEVRDSGRLTDSLDSFNVYVVAWIGTELVGFVSITPPGGGSYSIDKYTSRDRLPFAFDDRLHEVRLLTVRDAWRGRPVAVLLVYAALRWVEAHGGTRIMAIGRREIVPLYRKIGLEPVGIEFQSGAVTFEVLQAGVAALRAQAEVLAPLYRRLESTVHWDLDIPYRKPSPCFHGGAFFERIGERFENLDRRHDIINADVLDAWFPPAPAVLEALHAHLDWLLRTSPPTSCGGLVEAIAGARGVAPDNILTGAGSSDLIYLALRHWLKPTSRTLLLDPTYGEYAHVLERVVGCEVDRLVLRREDQYRVDPDELSARLALRHDLVVLVNPNSPTGRHIAGATLRKLLAKAPPRTRVWIDETYIDYVGTGESLERYAARSENVIVCKSMSKAYALSGARCAYLCAGAHQLEELRAITPPWAVGLPAQVAAVKALGDPEYYIGRHAETHRLREALGLGLQSLGIDVIPGRANYLLGHLPEEGPDAREIVAECRERGLFLRDASCMGTALGHHALRIAVKDAETNARMLAILSDVARASRLARS